MREVPLFSAVVLLASAAGTLQAQELRESPRAWLGASGTLGRPVGEFQQFVDWGGGLDVYSVIPVFGQSPFGMRLEGSLTLYGHEEYQAPLSTTVSRVTVDVNTANFIAGLGVGPQVTLGHGRIRDRWALLLRHGLVGWLGFRRRALEHQLRRRDVGSLRWRWVADRPVAREPSSIDGSLGGHASQRRGGVPAARRHHRERGRVAHARYDTESGKSRELSDGGRRWVVNRCQVPVSGARSSSPAGRGT